MRTIARFIAATVLVLAGIATHRVACADVNRPPTAAFADQPPAAAPTPVRAASPGTSVPIRTTTSSATGTPPAGGPASQTMYLPPSATTRTSSAVSAVPPSVATTPSTSAAAAVTRAQSGPVAAPTPAGTPPQGAGFSTPPSDATEDSSGERARSGHEKTEHFRIGVLGGVGFPRPLAVEGLFKVERTLALGAEYSVLPTLSISGVETTFHAIAADARVFLFDGPFFIGLRAGHQHLGGAGTVTVNGYGAQGSVTVDTTFVNPRLGLLWTFEPGFTVGIDAGVQFPLSSTTSTTLPQGTAINQQALSIGHDFGSAVIPTIDLLRIGFLI